MSEEVTQERQKALQRALFIYLVLHLGQYHLLLILSVVTYSNKLHEKHMTNTFDSGQQKHVYNDRLLATMVLTTHCL